MFCSLVLIMLVMDH